MDVVNRTFVGILVPPQVSDQMQQGMLLLKRKPGVENMRWSAPSEYMIQLSSLGELSPGTLATLQQVLPQIVGRFPPMHLTVTGFGGHPNLIQPRYAFADLGGDVQWLDQLAQAIDLGVAPYVPARDMRGFRPNVVIGRLKTESEPLRVALGRALKMTQTPDMGEIAVDSVDLLISRSNEFGIGYTVVSRLPLGSH
jgi:2'-5' RNA ligase